MESFSLTQLISDSSFGVKMVLIILLSMSIYSWSIILKKFLFLRKTTLVVKDFEDSFWNSGNLLNINKKKKYKKEESIHNIYKDIFKYFMTNFKHKKRPPRQHLCEILVGMFEVRSNLLFQQIKESLTILGTISSTSPYIGLFGTVYGILIAFWGLGLESGATIAEIAPSIAEALIATAMGLFVAIPALVAHNKFNNQQKELRDKFNNIEDEIVNLVNKSYLVMGQKKRAEDNVQ